MSEIVSRFYGISKTKSSFEVVISAVVRKLLLFTTRDKQLTLLQMKKTGLFS